MNSDKSPIVASDREPFECPNCGSHRLVQRSAEDTFAYGADKQAVELKTTVLIDVCEHCGSAFASESAQVARNDAICQHLGILTPAEIRQLRDDVATTQSELSRITGIGKASLARWEAGDIFQNVANDRLLRLLRYPDNIQRLRALANGEKMPGRMKAEASEKKFRALSETEETIGRAAAATFELTPTA